MSSWRTGFGVGRNRGPDTERSGPTKDLFGKGGPDRTCRGHGGVEVLRGRRWGRSQKWWSSTRAESDTRGRVSLESVVLSQSNPNSNFNSLVSREPRSSKTSRSEQQRDSSTITVKHSPWSEILKIHTHRYMAPSEPWELLEGPSRSPWGGSATPLGYRGRVWVSRGLTIPFSEVIIGRSPLGARDFKYVKSFCGPV